MFLTGLPLTTLLALGGVLGSLTVLLYVLKLRRRPVAVPFARIWTSILRDQEATNLFSQLKRLLSLLLQLLLIGLLILALGDPRLSASLGSARHVVVLVDTSASMKATDVAPSRLAQAKEKARELISGLAASDSLLIASMGATVTPLSTLTGEATELRDALDQLTATDTRADVRHALDFALDTLHGVERPEIILVSDGAFGDLTQLSRGLPLGDVKLSYIPVGGAGKNVAITEFSVRRYPLDKSRSEVLLELNNTNPTPVDVELTLWGDGQVIDVTRLALAAGERLPRFYPDLAGASHTLEATIQLADGTHDDLAADDHAYALMPERRRARILLASEGNTYLEAALLLDEYLDVTTRDPSASAPTDHYDVAIYDNVAPAWGDVASATLYLNPPVQGSPVRLGQKLRMFGFDTWEKKSPLLRFTAMENVQVLAGSELLPQPEDKVLGASNDGAILVSGRRQGKPFVALGFDPRQSDFVLRVAWPLFILNTINYFVEEDTGYVSSYRTGDVWRVPAPSGVRFGSLTGPDGLRRTIPVKDGRAVYAGDRAGLYQLSFDVGGEKSTTEFAANLSDLAESRIEAQPELAIDGQAAGSATGFSAGVRRELWVYLLLAVAIASSIEWLTYHRRWTV